MTVSRLFGVAAVLVAELSLDGVATGAITVAGLLPPAVEKLLAAGFGWAPVAGRPAVT